MDRPARVALALGAGGARGYAHIGAIQVITERGFQIVTVAGSSMGALVGGLHAAGKLPEYTDWAVGLSPLDVVRLLDFSLSAPGAIRAEKIFARVHDLLGGQLIEDLPIAYTAVATDLLARKEVWFQRGPLEVAIRSSIAIPGVITPVMLNGRLLADGGLMDPVPIAATAAVPVDVTIAVSLGGERGPVDGALARDTAEARPVDEWIERFRRSAARFMDRETVRAMMSRFASTPGEPVDAALVAVSDAVVEVLPGVDGPYGALPPGLSKLDMMTMSLEAMQSVLARYRLAGFPPDVLVTVSKDACRSLDFHRAEEMIELGRTLTEEALDSAGVNPVRSASPQPRHLGTPTG